jgi:hypothetical protein
LMGWMLSSVRCGGESSIPQIGNPGIGQRAEAGTILISG